MLQRIVVLFALVTFGTPALAAPPKVKEQRKNSQELRQDRRQAKDDRLDVAKLRTIHVAYTKAIQHPARSTKLIGQLEVSFLGQMRQEAAESRVEIAQKKGEVRRGTKEVRRDRGKVAAHVVKGQPVRAAADAARTADDKRDRRDDVRDLERERQTLHWRQRIRAEFATLRGDMAPAKLERKAGLMAEALQLARGEVVDTRQERLEDRKEKREDRRDLRKGVRR